MRLHDGLVTVTLADEIGRGGEGVVHALASGPDLAAKIYSTQPDQERCEKLQWMVAMHAQTPALSAQCAWPERLLRDDAGQIRGFVMRRFVAQRPVHELYNPEQRKQVFARVTWDVLAHAAASCAEVFALLHAQSVVVGDVNERNVLVGDDGRLRLVDCDSFQVRLGERVFKTGVGVVDYTPPELQQTDFRDVVRTANHDLFGLAVLVFKLVFMGRHPFSGGATGDLAAAIAQCDYDYPALAQRLKHLVPAGAVPSTLRALFDEAFGEECVDSDRPTAQQWVTELQRFAGDLQECPTEPIHRVPAAAPRCPWCQIEATLHYAYFMRPDGERYVSTWSPRLDELLALRTALSQTEPPPAPASFVAPDNIGQALQMGRRVTNMVPPAHLPSWHLRLVGWLANLGGTALLATMRSRMMVALWVAGASVILTGWLWALLAKRPWLRAIDDTRRLMVDVDHGADTWRAQAHQWRSRDRQLLDLFVQLHDQHESIALYREGEIEKLTRAAIDESVRYVLEQTGLEDAVLPRTVPSDRLRTLQIRGLTSAADIERERLTGLPGLTVTIIDALVQWRRSLEVQLGGQRRPAPRPEHFAAIDGNCTVLQEELETQMWGIVQERERLTAQAVEALDTLYDEMVTQTDQLLVGAERLWQALRQA